MSEADGGAPGAPGGEAAPDRAGRASVHAARLLRQVAEAVLRHYRTMDPMIAQFWASPGVTPREFPDASGAVGRPAG